MERIYDLRQKEIINTKDGMRFGFISDIEIDCESGKIKKLIVPGPGKILGMFGREQEYHIPWSCIKKVGDDIILIETESKDILKDLE